MHDGRRHILVVHRINHDEGVRDVLRADGIRGLLECRADQDEGRESRGRVTSLGSGTSGSDSTPVSWEQYGLSQLEFLLAISWQIQVRPDMNKLLQHSYSY